MAGGTTQHFDVYIGGEPTFVVEAPVIEGNIAAARRRVHWSIVARGYEPEDISVSPTMDNCPHPPEKVIDIGTVATGPIAKCEGCGTIWT